MANDIMDLDQLAVYLQRDAREVSKMASRGYLPGHKVSGEWRFYPAEINHWIETQMHAYTEQELSALEKGPEREPDRQPLVSALLSEATMAVPLRASSRASVLKELVTLAEQSWQVYDPEAVLEASASARRWAARPWTRAWRSRTRGGPCPRRWATTFWLTAAR